MHVDDVRDEEKEISPRFPYWEIAIYIFALLVCLFSTISMAGGAWLMYHLEQEGIIEGNKWILLLAESGFMLLATLVGVRLLANFIMEIKLGRLIVGSNSLVVKNRRGDIQEIDWSSIEGIAIFLNEISILSKKQRIRLPVRSRQAIKEGIIDQMIAKANLKLVSRGSTYRVYRRN